MATNINRQQILSRKLSGIQGTRSSTPEFTNLYSVKLNGSNQSLSLDTSPLLGTGGTDNWSVSFWIKARTIPQATNQRLFAFGSSGTLQTQMYISSSGSLTYGGAWTDQFSGWGGASGEWIHVIYRVNRKSASNNVGFAINGVIYDNKSVNITTTYDTTGNAYFGRNTGSFGFEGDMDDFAVWNKYLTDAECVEIFNLGTTTDLEASSAAANLQHWWRMGDPLGTGSYPTIVDVVAGNDAAMVNMTSANITTDVPA